MKLPFPFRSTIALALSFAAAGHALAQGPSETVFQRFDRNGDGRITRDELPNQQVFERFDTNQDGAITLEEYLAVAGGTPPATPGAPSSPEAPSETPPATPGPESGGAATRIESMIRALDRDGDGRITREEAGEAPWFARLDQNGDGVIDAEELAAARRFLSREGVSPESGPRGRRGMPAEGPAISPEEVASVTSGPELLHPGEAGVGRMVPDATFTDLSGESRRLSQVAGAQGLVVAMTSATCPLSKRYLPSLAALEEPLASQGLGLLLVNPFASERTEEIRAQLAPHGMAAPYVHDRDLSLSAALGATTTTEVFLIDARRTLVYRGALDDQYGIDYSLDAPRHRYLLDAVAALLAGTRPPVEATAAPGCELDLPTGEAPGADAPEITYHRDIARILRQNCVECHREGGIAPFALDDLAEVSDRARVIKRVVSEGTMPPWFAADPGEGERSPWANDRSLPARDKAALLAWIDSRDRPPGDPDEAPAPLAFAEEWAIGEPDLVLPLSRAYEIQATGFMPYQFDVVETELAEDRWVAAYEILPSARDVVHHVIVQVHEPGSEVRNLGEGAGGYWAIYVPGNGSHRYPEGFARRLPAGSKVSFQIHYTPSGTAKQERLRLGLVFAEEPPRYEVKTVAVANPQLAIPPGAPHHVETRSRRVPFDMPVMSFMPHMHVRGKAFRYEVTYPDGTGEILLDIPRYDFNWQLRYDYREPKLIPRGSTVTTTAVFDNSPGNRANPDPTQLVRWGSQTVDEMMIGYLEYFVPLGGPVAAADASGF